MKCLPGCNCSRHQPKSEETKRKISEAKRGRSQGPLSEEHKQKLRGRVAWNKGLTKGTDDRVAAAVNGKPFSDSHLESLKKFHRRRPKQLFGGEIPWEVWDRLVEKRPEVCQLCGQACSTGNKLALDHDHETGRVRGWLCLQCNVAIGRFGDNEEGVLRVLEFLRARDNLELGDPLYVHERDWRIIDEFVA